MSRIGDLDHTCGWPFAGMAVEEAPAAEPLAMQSLKTPAIRHYFVKNRQKCDELQNSWQIAGVSY